MDSIGIACLAVGTPPDEFSRAAKLEPGFRDDGFGAHRAGEGVKAPLPEGVNAESEFGIMRIRILRPEGNLNRYSYDWGDGPKSPLCPVPLPDRVRDTASDVLRMVDAGEQADVRSGVRRDHFGHRRGRRLLSTWRHINSSDADDIAGFHRPEGRRRQLPPYRDHGLTRDVAAAPVSDVDLNG